MFGWVYPAPILKQKCLFGSSSLHTLWCSCQLLNFSLNLCNLVLFLIFHRHRNCGWRGYHYRFFCNNHLCYFWSFWWTTGKNNCNWISSWRNFRPLQWCLQRIHYPLSFFSNSPNRTWLDFLFSHLAQPCCIYLDLFGAEYPKGIAFWKNRITGRCCPHSPDHLQFYDISRKSILVGIHHAGHASLCLLGIRFDYGCDLYSCRKYKAFATHT